MTGANRIGLAKSFQTERVKLNKSKNAFCIIFIIGILALIAIGFWNFNYIYSLEKGNYTNLDIIKFFAKFVACSPIIWGTWFCASKYTSINRLAEDYAFKESAAMAYDGYKKEASENANDEIKKELLLTAIRIFGENPTRLLSKHECIAPTQELARCMDIIAKSTPNK